MRGSLAGPRVLLRRLREIMAEPISAQDRLDKIVAQIASNMVAEVCSVYVLRADDVLELYATEGLKREAVHHAGLRVGQGLVGLIAADARPLNLPNAQSHPAFAYLPETGEEIYNAFLGVARIWNGSVPIGFVLGVALAVWVAMCLAILAVLKLASRDAPMANPDWIDSVKASLSDFAGLREH